MYEAAQRELDALRDPAVALELVLSVSAWLNCGWEGKVRLRESIRRNCGGLSRDHLVPTLGEIWLAELRSSQEGIRE